MPGITNWQHPRFFGYFPSNALLASVLGDYLSTGLGVIGLAWQSSPALTEVEEVATELDAADARPVGAVERRDQRHRVDQHAGGVDVRARASTNYSLARGGLQAEPRRWSSTPPRTVTALSRRRRCWPASASSTCASCRTNGVRDAARIARCDDPGRPRCRPSALRGRGDDRDDDVDRARSAGRDRRASPGRTASGCTSMPRWRARR